MSFNIRKIVGVECCDSGVFVYRMHILLSTFPEFLTFTELWNFFYIISGQPIFGAQSTEIFALFLSMFALSLSSRLILWNGWPSLRKHNRKIGDSSLRVTTILLLVLISLFTEVNVSPLSYIVDFVYVLIILCVFYLTTDSIAFDNTDSNCTAFWVLVIKTLNNGKAMSWSLPVLAVKLKIHNYFKHIHHTSKFISNSLFLSTINLNY